MVKWTREHIIREILRREAAGLPLNLGGEQPVGQALYQAGSRVFGSWRNAVMAAGIPPERARAKDDWRPCRILATIRSLSRRRRALRPAELDRRYAHLVRGRAAPLRIMGQGCGRSGCRSRETEADALVDEGTDHRGYSEAGVEQRTVEESGCPTEIIGGRRRESVRVMAICPGWPPGSI